MISSADELLEKMDHLRVSYTYRLLQYVRLVRSDRQQHAAHEGTLLEETM